MTSRLFTTAHALWILALLPPGVARQLLQGHAPVEGSRSEVRGDDALRTAAASLPPPLFCALDRIDQMSDQAGEEQLSSSLRREGVAPPPAPSRVAFAATVMVEHPKLFAEALSRRPPRPAPTYREHLGHGPAPRAWDESALEQLRERIGGFEQSRGRRCRIEAWSEGEQRHFLVWSAPHGADDGEPDAGDARGEPDGHLVLDAMAGRLRVAAPDEAARLTYTEAFGEALAGDPAFFSKRPVVVLEPLRVLGRAALAPTWGLAEVKLTELEFGWVAAPSNVCTLRGDDVFDQLDVFPPALRCFELRLATFALQHADDGSWHEVTLGIPGQVMERGHGDSRLTRTFFEERGFLLSLRRAA